MGGGGRGDVRGQARKVVLDQLTKPRLATDFGKHREWRLRLGLLRCCLGTAARWHGSGGGGGGGGGGGCRSSGVRISASGFARLGSECGHEVRTERIIQAQPVVRVIEGEAA